MSFWKSLAAWTATLAMAVQVYSTLLYVSQGQAVTVEFIVSGLPGMVSGLLPLTAFAAARRFGGRGQGRVLSGNLIGAAILSYVLVAGVHPHIQHRLGSGEPTVVDGYGELAAPTPLELSKRKRYVVEHPPEQHSLAVDQPLAMPPNWLNFLIYSPIVFSLFAILNGCFGAVLGRRYDTRSRRSARTLWLFGILSGASFMIPAMAAGDYVQASLSASGVAAAWLPLALPLIALLVCMRLFPCPPGEDEQDRSDEGTPARRS